MRPVSAQGNCTKNCLTCSAHGDKQDRKRQDVQDSLTIFGLQGLPASCSSCLILPAKRILLFFSCNFPVLAKENGDFLFVAEQSGKWLSHRNQWRLSALELGVKGP